MRVQNDKKAESTIERKYVEVVTTNRVVQVVDKVTITNYVIEVWTNGVLKSSRALDKPSGECKGPEPVPTPQLATVVTETPSQCRRHMEALARTARARPGRGGVQPLAAGMVRAARRLRLD